MKLTTAQLTEARNAILPSPAFLKVNPEYTERSYAYAIVSDTYKEANGIRPRWLAYAPLIALVVEYAWLALRLREERELAALEAKRQAEAEHRLTTPKTWTFAELAGL